MYTIPTITDFKAMFARDFPYGLTNSDVLNADVTSALADAGFNFNPAFYATQAQFSRCYLLLSAHYLVMNLRASAQGIAGQYNFLQNSKSVGSIAESFGIPERILANPELSMYCKTTYGANYLSFILPQLCGQMFPVGGCTKP